MPPRLSAQAPREWIARHPLASFIVLAYAISWTAWPLSYVFDLGVSNGFGIIGSLGPALAAVIVCALASSEKSEPSRSRWWLFAGAGAFALAVMVLRRLWITPAWLAVAGKVTTTSAFPTPMALPVDVLAAVAVALIISGVRSRRPGVRGLLRSLDLRAYPVRWYWWAIAIGAYPVVMVVSAAASSQLGLPVSVPQLSGVWYLLALDVVLTLLYLMIGGGGLEEPGWRGLALPLLQKRSRPLRASLILAVIWALWHLPLLLLEGASPVAIVPYLLLEVVPLAILFTAVFGLTKGSLPVVILLHASINVAPIFLPTAGIGTIVFLVLMIGVAVWMWRSPQTFAAGGSSVALQD